MGDWPFYLEGRTFVIFCIILFSIHGNMSELCICAGLGQSHKTCQEFVHPKKIRNYFLFKIKLHFRTIKVLFYFDLSQFLWQLMLPIKFSLLQCENKIIILSNNHYTHNAKSVVILNLHNLFYAKSIFIYLVSSS